MWNWKLCDNNYYNFVLFLLVSDFFLLGINILFFFYVNYLFMCILLVVVFNKRNIII